MKYLKLFENHQLYTEISEDEFDDAMDERTSIPFTEKEYQIICNMCKDKYELRGVSSKDIRITFTYSAVVENSMIEIGYMGEIMFSMWKFSDEWFYLEDEDFGLMPPYVRKYYKCDEFEGLVNCLKNILEQ